ncbi:MAG: FAD-dependent oxidoreductase, partial [Rhodanobacter sp.]
FPRDLATLWRVLQNRSIDIRYRSGAMLASLPALRMYWRYSAPGPFAHVVSAYGSLIQHCTEEHAEMIQQAGAEALVRKEGWLEAFRTQQGFDAKLLLAEDAKTRFGVEYATLDRSAFHARQSALSEKLIGGIHWSDSWSVVDPGALVQAYARAFESLGGRIVQADARGIAQVGTPWSLTTSGGTLTAGELVLATGPWSGAWFKRLGYRMPLFHMRGYHMHYSAQAGATLRYAVMDSEKGYLLSPQSAGIRLTTGAELNTLDAPRSFAQLQAAEDEARRIFPLGERRDAQPWMGARPCLADMKPVIGRGHHHTGLWFAFGHAHQGFTLGPITGRLLGEMMDGETPCVDMTPFRANRF